MVRRKESPKDQERRVKITKKAQAEEPEVTMTGSSRLMRARRTGGVKRTFWLFAFIIIFLGVGWFAARAMIVGLGGDSSNFWAGLFKTSSVNLIGEEDGRVNILILGHPGGGDEVDGPFLTDTLMVASYNVEDNYLHLFSIPRDTYVSIEDYGMSKINGVFEIGRTKFDDGPGTAMRTVGDLLGLGIPYYVKIDFEGFEQVIDSLGGVNIEVEKDLHDQYYPTPDKGYETLDIPAGTYTMDGAMALKYARSRKTTSDFDRARRQQKILLALRDRAMDMELLTAPKKVIEISEIVKDHFSTNLKTGEIERALELMVGIDPERIYNKVFDDGPNGVLYGTKVDGIFVLKPINDDYTKISDSVALALSRVGDEATTDEDADLEPLKVEVLNGTNITGLAGRTRDKLEQAGFEVVRVGNNPTRGFTDSIIYDGTGGGRFSAINRLADLMNATISEDDSITPGSGANVRLVLGESAK
ncbi:hypothetical protein DRH29_01850 [candidate division Kazan bacterium]|uniref:LytR family transcriptional regulator n=1 Tax=candidate division Kazan bacterium TaxID=2202143 RepID=A0A420ZD41_UNCK3|nr:MAG: hypothetical protein DRH29_01850 [candidate division Kazan bacterium]